MKEKITVMVKEPEEVAQVKEIDNTLDQLHKIVGGYIEVTGFTDNILIICDEEGKMKWLRPNFQLRNDTIVGTVIFVGNGEDGEFKSLTIGQIEKIKTRWR